MEQAEETNSVSSYDETDVPCICGVRMVGNWKLRSRVQKRG